MKSVQMQRSRVCCSCNATSGKGYAKGKLTGTDILSITPLIYRKANQLKNGPAVHVCDACFEEFLGVRQTATGIHLGSEVVLAVRDSLKHAYLLTAKAKIA